MPTPAYFGRMRFGCAGPSPWARRRRQLLRALPKILITAGALVGGLLLLFWSFR